MPKLRKRKPLATSSSSLRNKAFAAIKINLISIMRVRERETTTHANVRAAAPRVPQGEHACEHTRGFEHETEGGLEEG